MKLLLTARWPVGGIRTYLRYIYTQPVFANIQMTVLAPDLNFRDFFDRYLSSSNVRYIQAPEDNRGLTRAIKTELSRDQYDMLHSHGYSSGVLGRRATLGIRLPHIMTAHDVFRREQFRKIRGKLKWVGLNTAYRGLDKVLTVGEDCQENFVRYMPMVPKHKIRNIDHGVDTQRFANAPARDFRRELGIPESVPLIGFFGRFMAQKGFMDLVSAIKNLSEVLPENCMPRVLTFGWGGFVREEFAQIEVLGLSRYFIQLPFTDEVPEAIRGVDMVAMPSRWEACGLLAMEVLAAGKPLIATNCQGLRCVVRDTPVRSIAPRDPDALTSAILAQLSRGPSDFEAYQSLAVMRFGLERPAQELYGVYRAVLEGCQ